MGEPSYAALYSVELVDVEGNVREWEHRVDLAPGLTAAQRRKEGARKAGALEQSWARHGVAVPNPENDKGDPITTHPLRGVCPPGRIKRLSVTFDGEAAAHEGGAAS